MGKEWTAKREKLLTRSPDGTFRRWRGGKTNAPGTSRPSHFQGIAIHTGQEFKRQHGRPAKVGEVVRHKNKSGRYHKQAFWYVKTPNGWRSSGITTRPNAAKIRAICAKSRKGRR